MSTYITEDDRKDYFKTVGSYGSDEEVAAWLKTFQYKPSTTIPKSNYPYIAKSGSIRFNPSKEAAKQVGGSHYQLPIQPIDYILKNKLGYCEANVIKYVTRHANKNGAEDIRKAIHYLEMILENDYAD